MGLGVVTGYYVVLTGDGLMAIRSLWQLGVNRGALEESGSIGVW